MRLARFVALIGVVAGSTTTTTSTPDDFAIRFIEAYKRCYNEVSLTAKTVPYPSRREPMDAAAFEAVKDCAAKYLRK